MARSIQNTPCHSVDEIIIPPRMGAHIGANDCTALSIEKNLANSFPLYKSVAIEREITIPPAPANPCTKRKNRKNSIPVENKQPAVETI